MTALTIDRVALRAAPGTGLATRKRALARLGRIDPAQPGAPNEVLVLRHLADPLPGALGAVARRDGRAAWERALSARLDALRTSAARPARGETDAQAEAVLFADEAEMRACLARHMAAGRPAPWWARALQRRLPPGAGAAEVLVQAPHLLPAMAAALVAQGAAVAVLGALTPRETAQLAEAIGLPAPPASAAMAPGGTARGAQPPRRSATPSVAQALRALPPAAARLLAALSLRHAVPQLTGRPLARAAEAACAHAGAPIGVASERGSAATKAPDPDVRASPDPQFAPPVEDMTAPTGPPIEPPRAEMVSSPRKEPTSPPSPPRTSDAPAEIPPPRALEAHSDAISRATPDATPDAAPVPERDAGHPTALGGVWCLVNLYTGAIPARAPDLLATLRAATRAEDGPWAPLERLARALLTPDEAVERDALWQILADLDARPPEIPTLPGPADHAAAKAARAWIEAAAGAELDSLLRRPARICVTPAHLDIVFPGDSDALALRLAGLDLDPGWQPHFGRIIAFHYRDDGVAP